MWDGVDIKQLSIGGTVKLKSKRTSGLSHPESIRASSKPCFRSIHQIVTGASRVRSTKKNFGVLILTRMAEQQSHRSHLRDDSGPQAVEASGDRDKPRGNVRRQRDRNDRAKPRSRKSNMTRSPKSPSRRESARNEGAHRRRSSHSSSANLDYEIPALELEVVTQPLPVVPLGLTVDQTIVVSFRGSSSSRDIDTSNLFTVTSLVADTRGGERVALEAGYLAGQKTLDSIHALPQQYVERSAREEPSRLSVGYSSFANLLIRQHGLYRIRTTLMKMGAAGATTLHAVDSNPITVERPNMQRRLQRS